MRHRPVPDWLRPSAPYAVAVCATLLAMAVRSLLGPLLSGQLALLLFASAVVVSAWYGGLGPGLVATVLGGVCGAMLFLPPSGAPQVDSTTRWTALALFLFNGGLLSWLCASLRAARRRADRRARVSLDQQRLLEREATQRQQAEAELTRGNEELERRVAERTAALAESEALIRAILDTAAEGIVTIDERGIVLSINKAAEAMFAYPAAELVGQSLRMLMPSPFREEHDSYLDRYRATGLRRVIGTRREVVGRRRDGSTFPLDLAVSELRVGERRLFTGIIRDIRQRRALEQQVLEIAGREQRRIGQDLHDGMGQELTGVAYLVDALREALAARTAPETELAERIAARLQRMHQQLRRLTKEIVPFELDAGGLAMALEELCREASLASRVDCRFESAATVHVADNETATQLYRIAQESLANALKHGHARQVRLKLGEPRRGWIALSVADDGVGFDPDAGSGGLGLGIMRYRAGLIGADLTIARGADGGTLVQCVLTQENQHVDAH